MQAIPLPSQSGAPMGRDGIVSIKSPEQVTKEMEARKSTPSIEVDLMEPELLRHARSQWEAAKIAKIDVEQQMARNQRQANGEYEEAKKAAIAESGGTDAYFNMTATKVKAAIAWIEDIMFPPGDKPWGLKPTPIPTVNPADVVGTFENIVQQIMQDSVSQAMATGTPPSPEEVGRLMQKSLERARDAERQERQDVARRKCDRMERKIQDMLLQGGFYEALTITIANLVELKAGILRGPIFRKKAVKSWGPGKGGLRVLNIKEEVSLEFDAISPYDYYPASDAKCSGDGPEIIRNRIQPKWLNRMRGVNGWRSEAITRVLEAYRHKGANEWLWTDDERKRNSANPAIGTHSSSKIDVLMLFDSVPGAMLEEFGVKGIDDPTEYYEIECWWCGGEILRIVLNPDPMGRRNIHVASFVEDAESVWGYGAPEEIKDDQEAANGIFRSIINNAAMSAGPLVEENKQRLAPGEEPGQIYPMKVYSVTDEHMTGTPAVRFHNVLLTANRLVDTLQFVSGLADEHSGVPAYAHGNEDVGGAGDTASGLSMLMNMASKGIKKVIRNIDRGLIRGSVTMVYDYLMQNDPDPDIKGDADVDAVGATAMIVREQTVLRQREALDATNNNVDLQIIGMDGRRYMLRDWLKNLGHDPEKILPENSNQFAQGQQGVVQPGMPQPGMPNAPAPGVGMPGTQAMKPPVALDAAGNPVAGQHIAQFQEAM